MTRQAKFAATFDGIMRASATPANSAIVDDGTALALGAQTSGGIVDMNGWLDEVRITKGRRSLRLRFRLHTANRSIPPLIPPGDHHV